MTESQKKKKPPLPAAKSSKFVVYFQYCAVFLGVLVFLSIFHSALQGSSSRPDQKKLHQYHALLSAEPTVDEVALRATVAEEEVVPNDFPDSSDVGRLFNESSSRRNKKEFSGEKFRTFPRAERVFKDAASSPDYQMPASKTDHNNCKLTCDKWAVVMTTFPQQTSEAIRRLTYTDWCVLVVGDRNQPKEYKIRTTVGQNVLFLNEEEQSKIGSEFVDSLPWESFGRKNVGYLYAIACGAKSIWDFDEDNSIKFWIKGASPDPKLEIWSFADNTTGSVEASTYAVPNAAVTGDDGSSRVPVFNPYPVLGCPKIPCWPRGFPYVKNLSRQETQTGTKLTRLTIPRTSIGVLQSLADHQPDVDSVVLSEMLKAPLVFGVQQAQTKELLIVPPGQYSPTNAQAALHFEKAFFGLYLPISVVKQVSDIWRGYVCQSLLHMVGMQIGFLPRPIVVRDKSNQNIQDEFTSEMMQYVKSVALIKFLKKWSTMEKGIRHNNISTGQLLALAEELWIEMYERGFVEIQDVYLYQKWLRALYSIGHPFMKQTNLSGKERRSGLTFNVGQPIHFAAPDIPENCKNLPRKTFWTSDLHDGCRIDTPSVLSYLGQKVIVAGTKRGRSPYPFVFRDPNIEIYTKLSPLIKGRYVAHHFPLTQSDIDSNYRFFQSDPKVQSVDGFICQFPASMCQVWMPFNKSIMFTPAHRYNIGRCSPSNWDKLDKELVGLSKSQGNLIGGLSRYDVEYINYYTNLGAKLTTGFSGFYTKGNPFKPTRPEIIGVGVQLNDPNTSLVIKGIHQLYPRYTLQNLVSHRALVYAPYSVMSYKLTEFYSLGIPLFMPSAKFMRERNGMGPDRAINTYYCRDGHNQGPVRPKHPGSPHPYSPNVEFKDLARNGPESEMYWLQLADFFHLPHITHYDNMTDLIVKLNAANFTDIHERMMRENLLRKDLLLQNWCHTIQNMK